MNSNYQQQKQKKKRQMRNWTMLEQSYHDRSQEQAMPWSRSPGQSKGQRTLVPLASEQNLSESAP